MKRTSHSTAANRDFQNHVLYWLNGAIPDPSETSGFYRPTPLALARVENVLELAKVLPTLKNTSDQESMQRAVTDLSDKLSLYPGVLQCRISPLARLKGKPWAIDRLPADDTFDAREFYVIESIISLAQADQLNCVMRCICGRWYFQKKGDHSSCSTACRKRKHESTPEYKAAKALRAKENRALRKRGYSLRQKRSRTPKRVAKVAA
jgi:hypothetical protein